MYTKYIDCGSVINMHFCMYIYIQANIDNERKTTQILNLTEYCQSNWNKNMNVMFMYYELFEYALFKHAIRIL